MKRVLIVVLAIVGVVVALAAAAPLIISTDVVKRRIADQITHWTGRAVTFEGDPKIALYPYLTVKLRDVRIANPHGMGDKPFIRMEGMTGKIELLPLLIGQIEIAEFRLINPRINLEIDAGGRSNWSMEQGVVGTQAAKGDSERISDDIAPPSPLADISLGRFVIRDGIVTFRDARSGRKEDLRAVNVDFGWPSTADAAAGSGAFEWRGEKVEFTGSLGSPLQLLAGGSSPVRVAIASTLVRLSLDGTALQLDGIQVDGDATVTMPSVRGVLEWIGMPIGSGPVFGAGTVGGKVNWVGQSVSFSDAAIELDGNTAEGAIAIGAVDGALNVQGTLAFERLDLSPYLEALRASLSGASSLATAPIGSWLQDAGNIDLRLSTNQAIVGSAEFGRAAAAVKIEGGRLTVDVGETQFATGEVQVHATAETKDGALSGQAQLKLDGIPARAALSQFAGVTSLDGTGTATVDVLAKGTSLAEFAASVTGQAAVSIADGSLDGITISELPLLVQNQAAPSGSTAFKAASCTIAFDATAIATEDLLAEGEGYSIRLAGKAWLFSPAVEARGVLTMPAANGGEPSEFPFMLGGTRERPTFAPDLGPTIKRGADPPGSG